MVSILRLEQVTEISLEFHLIRIELKIHLDYDPKNYQKAHQNQLNLLNPKNTRGGFGF